MHRVMGAAQRDPEVYECVDPACGSQAVEGSPVPLCPMHLRETFEFAQAAIGRYMGEPITVKANKIAAAKADADKPQDQTPGFVYFVRIRGLIKIGYTTYPKARFKSLRPDKVLAIVPGTLADEKRCHLAFTHLLAEAREYFRPAPDLLAFIEDMKLQSVA